MGYIYAVLATLGITLLGVSYKLSDQLKCDKHQVNLFFLSFAAMLALVWASVVGRPMDFLGAAKFGTLTGIAVIVAVLAFRDAVAKGRISTSWTILNLSMVVPVLFSIAAWHEWPNPKHWLGLILVMAAIVLIGIDVGRSNE